MPDAPPTPAPAPPRRRALRWLALASPLLLAASLLRPLPQDEGVLLLVAGRPVDAAGHLQAAWQRLARQCGTVQAVAPGTAAWDEARAALAAHSPPASQGARPLQLLASGSGSSGTSGSSGGSGDRGPAWLLAEVVWDAPVGTTAPLDPAIVPLQRVAGRWQVQDAGVWSGDTGPWQAPVFIRRWLQRQVPALPAALADCLDPQWPTFSR